MTFYFYVGSKPLSIMTLASFKAKKGFGARKRELVDWLFKLDDEVRYLTRLEIKNQERVNKTKQMHSIAAELTKITYVKI